MSRPLATATFVDRGQPLAFVRPRRRAIVLTHRGDGCPLGSPLRHRGGPGVHAEEG